MQLGAVQCSAVQCSARGFYKLCVHCTMCTCGQDAVCCAQCQICSVVFALCSLMYRVCGVLSVQCSVFCVKFVVDSVLPAVCIVHCAVFSVQYTGREGGYADENIVNLFLLFLFFLGWPP